MTYNVPDIRQYWVPRILWQILQLGSRSQTALMSGKNFPFSFLFSPSDTNHSQGMKGKKSSNICLEIIYYSKGYHLHSLSDWIWNTFLSFRTSWYDNRSVIVTKLVKYLKKQNSILVLALLWSYCFKTIKRQTEKNYKIFMTLP